MSCIQNRLSGFEALALALDLVLGLGLMVHGADGADGAFGCVFGSVLRVGQGLPPSGRSAWAYWAAGMRRWRLWLVQDSARLPPDDNV